MRIAEGSVTFIEFDHSGRGGGSAGVEGETVVSGWACRRKGVVVAVGFELTAAGTIGI